MEVKLPREGAAFYVCLYRNIQNLEFLICKLSSSRIGSPGEQDVGLLNEGWQYCLGRRHTRALKLQGIFKFLSYLLACNLIPFSNFLDLLILFLGDILMRLLGLDHNLYLSFLLNCKAS